MRLDYGKTDRGGSYRDDPSRQAWRQDLDPCFPAEIGDQEARRNAYGEGKGSPEEWVAVVKPGMVMYEMEGVTRDVAKEAFRLAAHKLPIATKFLAREIADEN